MQLTWVTKEGPQQDRETPALKTQGGEDEDKGEEREGDEGAPSNI